MTVTTDEKIVRYPEWDRFVLITENPDKLVP